MPYSPSRASNLAIGVTLGTLSLLLAACSVPGPGDGGSGTINTKVVAQGPASGLTGLDVSIVVERAARAVSDSPITIAVVDREGNILGVFSRPAPTAASAATEEVAVGLARTGAFFSNDSAPLSSELIRFLSREHFPENVLNTPSADLFGIEHTNRGCPLTGGPLTVPYVDAAHFVPPATNIAGTDPGPGIICRPGGFPLYKNNRLVGGVGVSGSADPVNEFAGLTATTGYQLEAADPGKIFLGGIILPYLAAGGRGERPTGTVPGDFPGSGAFRGGIPGIPVAGVRDSPVVAAPFAPEGYLIGPADGALISAVEVDGIVQAAVRQANLTRAAIRLPAGSKASMVIAVAEAVGNATVSRGALLALFRMPDATVFSIDVAAAKARNVIYFSDTAHFPGDLPGVPPGTAVTNRTIGFGAQSMYPSGIDGSGPGPFRALFLHDLAYPCTQGQDPGNDFGPPAAIPPMNPITSITNRNGIVFFPGSTPLYRNGAMVAGLGVSGDGVAQDDVVTNAAAHGYLPPPAIRADQLILDDVRLPYFKFSRSPEQ
ncbi:MAG: heme-binding protein [Candidatus Riflebacteria bacterium]|nr:heme-binding protein [Candidatus Riflebacteria bacterium]